MILTSLKVDSPNTSPDGDFEIDGFANLGASECLPRYIVQRSQKDLDFLNYYLQSNRLIFLFVRK